MSMFKPALAAAALAVAAVSAQATVTAGLGSLSASFIDLSVSGVVTGGALYTLNAVPYAAIPHDAAGPITTVGTWLAAGGTNNDGNGGGDAVLHLGVGTTGVSFLWGSPDNYNSFVVNVTGGSSATYSFLSSDTQWTALGIALDQRQDKAYYVTFSTDVGYIDSVAFKSTTNAIEIANVAVVPEPEAYGLALAGLSIVGFAMARRRKG